MSPVHAGDTPSPAPPALGCFVVEDSAVIRHNLLAALEDMLGARIVGVADDEPGALAWMASHHASPCHLIIIDIFLRVGTGLEVLRQARTLCPHARRVVLTNYATDAMRQRCLQLGADRVFDKSSELEDLLAYCAALAAPGATE